MTAAGWIIAILWTVIILALIAGAIYWLASMLTSRDHDISGTVPEASAREILDRRLAKGEVSIEQYAQLREAIDGAPTQGSREPIRSRPASAPG